MSNDEDRKSNVQVIDIPTPKPVNAPAQKEGRDCQGFWQRSKTHVANWLEPGRPGQQQSTIAPLDGVRALACLIVVGYHINLITMSMHVWSPKQQPLAVAALLLAGGAGVTLFFVLSGFLLFLPYAKALLLKSAWPSVRRFYMRRALRIIPAYYICLFMLIYLTHREYLQPGHLPQLTLFLTFFMDSSSATFRMLNGPFWSLAVEWQFYLWLPWLALGVRVLAWRCPPKRRLLAIIAGLLAIVAWGMISQVWSTYLLSFPLPAAPGWQIVSMVLFGHGKYLQDFAIGALISLLYIYTRYADSQKRVHDVLQRFSLLFWAAGLALLFFMALWNVNIASWRVGLMDILYTAGSEAGFSLGFGLCILAVLFGATAVKNLFSWTPLRWVGHISYSAYMWHLPLLIFFIRVLRSYARGWHPLLIFASYWLWVLLVILPFSAIAFIITERPGMQLSNWLAAREQRKTMQPGR